MSIIYLKVTIKTLSKVRFSPSQFLGSSISCRYLWILKLLVATWKSEIWEQNCVRLFHYFHSEKNYDVLQSKGSCILLNKNTNFNKNETESKMEIPRTVLERWTLCFSSYKNHKLKLKLWWVGARKRKKRAYFVPFILSEGSVNICVLSLCSVYWKHFQNSTWNTFVACF